jgi:hypothetical protein
MCCLLQCFLPALPGDNSALRVKIEQYVLPTVFDKPVSDLPGFLIVVARMADEDAGHGLVAV